MQEPETSRISTITRSCVLLLMSIPRHVANIFVSHIAKDRKLYLFIFYTFTIVSISRTRISKSTVNKYFNKMSISEYRRNNCNGYNSPLIIPYTRFHQPGPQLGLSNAPSEVTPSIIP